VLLVTFLLITKLSMNDIANVVSKGGCMLLTIVYSVNKNQGSEHYVMMTLFKAIRNMYCVKTHNTNVQLTLVLIKMEQVTKAKG